MTTLRKVAQAASDEWVSSTSHWRTFCLRMQELRDELAKPDASAPQPAGREPVARAFFHAHEGWKIEWLGAAPNGGQSNYLYVAPQPAAQQERTPLTDEQKRQMWIAATIDLCSHENCYRRGIEDAEKHYGIKGESCA